MKIPVKILDKRAQMPTFGSAYSAGADLHACLTSPVSLAPGQTLMISIGIAMEIPKGYVGLVFARSGLALRNGLAPANKVGVVDSDYRGEFHIALHNHSEKVQIVQPGDRIAQLIIMPAPPVEFMLTDELSATERGEGGFGSTGK
ncbi:MAG: dUTP diphosphatase [Christensenellaceae bacterium]|nr:dUTP diphosphatase [Christensenellaceae bacterium]